MRAIISDINGAVFFMFLRLHAGKDEGRTLQTVERNVLSSIFFVMSL